MIGELEISAPDEHPGGGICFARIPNKVLDMLTNNQCRLVKKGGGCCVIMSENGDMIGELKASPIIQTQSSKFDGVLVRNGDILTPIRGPIREFTCKGLIQQVNKVPKKTKKSSIIKNQSEIELPREPALGWNSQKTFDTLRALKKRFSEDENDALALLKELRSQVTTDPRSIDARTLASVFKDIDRYKQDMTGCHVMLRRFNSCVENLE